MADSEAKRVFCAAWRAACQSVSPSAILARGLRTEADRDEAILAWGKASGTFLDVWADRSTGPKPIETLAIVPHGARPPRTGSWIEGGHPLPDEGSLQAGELLLEFFDRLRRSRVKRLRVFLSGGASSSAWIPPLGQSLDELRQKNDALLCRGLDIRALNRKRAALCALKNGGAARWLARLSPSTRARVFAISDVWPYGPEVIGSGPFYDGKIPHTVLAGNPDFVSALGREVATRFKIKAKLEVLHPPANSIEDWRNALVKAAKRPNKNPRVIALGGEPLPRLREGARRRGGRMTHLALLLYEVMQDEIAAGRISGICASSDGRDGSSYSAGAILSAPAATRLKRAEILRALRFFDSASPLFRVGALLPLSATGTNVQDAAVLIVRP